MRIWYTIKVDQEIISELGGLISQKDRLIKVLNKAYKYTFDDKTCVVYGDYIEISTPDGNAPTRKDKVGFANSFLEEFSEFELIKSQKDIYSLFLYDIPKENIRSEKLRRLYDL